MEKSNLENLNLCIQNVILIEKDHQKLSTRQYRHFSRKINVLWVNISFNFLIDLIQIYIHSPFAI